jgi:hypothetical protein
MITSVPGAAQPDLSCHLNSVEEGQRIVDDGDGWSGLERLRNSFLAVRRFGNNLPIRLLTQQRAQARSNHLVIIGNEDFYHSDPRPRWGADLRVYLNGRAPNDRPSCQPAQKYRPRRVVVPQGRWSNGEAVVYTQPQTS